MVTKGICEKYTKMTVGVRLTLTKKRAIIQALPQECGGDSFAVRANITAKDERYIHGFEIMQCSVGDSAFAPAEDFPQSPTLYGSYTRKRDDCRDGMGNCSGGKYETADNQR